MARPYHCFCFYYVQGEEGESPEEPNAFQIAGAGGVSSITLKQFTASFPLSRSGGGTYHFRFKVSDPAFGFAWQDATGPESLVPLWEDGAVHCKALRLDQRPLRPPSRLRRKPMLAGRGGGGVQRGGSIGGTSSAGSRPTSVSSSLSSNGGGHTTRNVVPPSPGHRPQQQQAAPAPAASDRPPAMRPTPTVSSGPAGGIGRASSAPAPTPTAAPTRPPAAGGDDLDSFLYGGSMPAQTAARSAGGSTPQRPPAPTGRATSSPAAGGAGAARGRSTSPPPPTRNEGAGSPVPPTGPMSGLDIDGDEDEDASPGAAASGGGSGRGGSPLPTQQGPGAKAPVSEEAAFFAQTATAEEIAARKEEREQEAIRVKHGAKLEGWATDPLTKKPRNVRTLLSTMHAVLWEGCSWRPVSLGDLMMPDRVKFHYRKAMLVLHPDKNVTGSAEQRFIAEKVFTSVNEAYNVFSAQELK